jgi:hypothetical protein
MNTFNKFTGRSIWLAALVLATLVSGCGGSSNHKSGTAPTVTSTNPADAATDVPLNNKVIATFSEAMNGSSIDTISFKVKGAGEAALVGTVSLDAATNTASFVPGSNLTASTLYTATLTTAIKSSADTALASDYDWSFTSGTTADTTAPTLTSIDPANAATGVAINRSVSANFSEALDGPTVNASTFTLSAGVTPVSGTVSYDNKVATFNPASNLEPNTAYTATLTTAITDLAANSLAANAVWSFTTGTAVAAGPATVNLRTAGDFVILAKSGISTVPASAITGDIGVSPIDQTAITGFSAVLDASNEFSTSAQVTGKIYAADYAVPTPTKMTTAVSDMETAYTDAAGRTTPDFIDLGAGEIGGRTLAPGLYKWGTSVLITTDVTLSGGPNDVWIFQISGNLTQADGKSVILTGGALPKNIFWQVAGGVGVEFGTTAHFEGVVLAAAGITVNTGASVNGRLLAQTAVTLDMNAVTQPAP